MWQGSFLVVVLRMVAALAEANGILDGAAAATAQRAKTVADLAELDHISMCGVEVMAGMLESFVHTGNLTEDELRCMLTAANNYTHLAYQAAEDLAQLFSPLMSPTDTIAQAAVAAADLVLVVPKLEASLERLAMLLAQFMGPCVDDQAQESLRRAGEHLSNLTYVAGHLRANGADIVQEMADAVKHFDHEEFRHFGHDVGRALRKVLLSRALPPMLPEGAPTEEELERMSAGVIQGFFGKGFAVDITSDAEVASEPAEPNARKAEPLDLHIDLHKCVKKNLKYFQSATLGTSFYFAQTQFADEQAGSGILPSFLTTTLAELPNMLRICGVTDEQQEMLVDSLLALDQLHVHFQLPAAAQDADFDETVKQLKRAADDWKALDWFALGKDLGKMLQGLVLQVFPQQYAVDDAGALRKRLLGLAVAAPAGGVAAPAASAALLLSLVAVLGIRRRSCGRPLGSAAPEHHLLDTEAAVQACAVE